jgi:hypothetical protein
MKDYKVCFSLYIKMLEINTNLKYVSAIFFKLKNIITGHHIYLQQERKDIRVHFQNASCTRFNILSFDAI